MCPQSSHWYSVSFPLSCYHHLLLYLLSSLKDFAQSNRQTSTATLLCWIPKVEHPKVFGTEIVHISFTWHYMRISSWMEHILPNEKTLCPIKHSHIHRITHSARSHLTWNTFCPIKSNIFCGTPLCASSPRPSIPKSLFPIAYISLDWSIAKTVRCPPTMEKITAPRSARTSIRRGDKIWDAAPAKGQSVSHAQATVDMAHFMSTPCFSGRLDLIAYADRRSDIAIAAIVPKLV